MIIRFQPYNREAVVAEGENVLRAAMAAGVYIQASCGGEGVCGKCKVLIEKGNVRSEPDPRISEEEYRQGYRLACRTVILSDADVRVPVESELDKQTLSRTRDRISAGRKVSHPELESMVLGWCFNPAVQKRYVEMEPPSAQDNRSDFSRLLLALRKQHGLEGISVVPRLLQRLPFLLREAEWKVTATLAETRMESHLLESPLIGSRPCRLIGLETGDHTKEHYSIALDVGTTSVWGQLVDLNKRAAVAEASDYNAQIRFGDDVISRVVYSQRPGGLKILQETIRNPNQ